MKKTLASIYKDKTISASTCENPLDYHWFLDEENAPIGIENSITQEELQLLELHYIPIKIHETKDIKKILWLKFLTSNESGLMPAVEASVLELRFIFFHYHLDVDLQEALDMHISSYHPHFMVLFLDSTHGVILDMAKKDPDNDEEMLEFLKATREDFHGEISFYETGYYRLNQQLPSRFKAEWEMFETFKKSETAVMTYKDVFLNYLFSYEHLATYAVFDQWFNDLLIVDRELLAVVKAYLENGFNVTVGAKALHMHRNTFMNKMDRFIDLTGLDIKKFEEAMIAYFFVRLKKNL